MPSTCSSGVLCDATFNLIIIPTTKEGIECKKVYLGSHRHAWTFVSSSLAWPSSCTESVASVIETFLAPPTHSPERDERAVVVSPSLRLSFSLLVQNPSDDDVRWKFAEAYQAFLAPTVEKLRPVLQIDVDSQILRFVNLKETPQWDAASRVHYLRPEQLPYIRDADDWNLETASSLSPPLHFVLFVPSKSQSPLYIQNSKGQRATGNTMLIPRWGSFSIHTPRLVPDALPPSAPADRSNTTTLSSMDLLPVFEHWLGHLRLLLGLQPLQVRGVPAEIVLGPNDVIADWEVDQLMRYRSAAAMASVAKTSVSLVQLVSQLPGMPVLPRIQALHASALQLLDQASAALAHGNLLAAANASRLALQASNEAFFDPSMLAMLYFPDEHKLAVYIPMVLPVSVPVLVGFARELKAWRSKRYRP